MGRFTDKMVAGVVSEPPMDRERVFIDVGKDDGMEQSKVDAEETQRKAQPRDAGYTPSGGSTCQQSSRVIMLLLFVLTAALGAMVIQAAFDMKTTFDLRLAELQVLETNADNTTAAYVAQVQSLVDAYQAALDAGTLDPINACDAAWFANSSSNEIHDTLVGTFELMDNLVGYAVILGTISTCIYLLVKCCVSYSLVLEINREDNPVGAPAAERRRFQPIVMIAGMPETVQQRRTRIYLRSETLGYMLVNALQDVPLVTFSLTYYMMTRSTRGTTCARCFDQREVCEVGDLSSLDSTVKLAMVFVGLSLFWNVGLLMERWIEWVKYKREIRQVYFNPRRYLIFGLLFIALYCIIIVTPMLILYYYEIGPTYFGLAGAQLQAVQVAGFSGAAIWGLVAVGVVLLGGLDLGEIICFPCLCFEVCDAALEPAQEACCCFCC